MQSKIGLMTLSAITPFMLLGGTTASAESPSTDKKDTSAQTKSAEKAPEKVYVDVQSGDTLSSIADAHQTSYVRIFDANESIQNPDIIDVGQKFRIPDASEQLPDRVLPAAPEVKAAVQNALTSSPVQAGLSQSATGTMPRGSSAGNTYPAGWCTWWAKEKRPDIPNQLGNAGNWTAKLGAMGFRTGTAPEAGAIAEQSGHVAYVESVNGNMVTVSEYGWNYTQGQKNIRTVPASTFYGYTYITR